MSKQAFLFKDNNYWDACLLFYLRVIFSAKYLNSINTNKLKVITN
jgi:hypothetical protein